MFTKKFVREMYGLGIKFCGKCKKWKAIRLFRNNFNDMTQLHRWCEECEKEYLHVYNLRKKYGENFKKLYFRDKERLFDLKGVKWDSIDEKNITNWMIKNKVAYGKGPPYKKLFSEERDKRRKFDWIVWINGEKYYVEYFGLWDITSTYPPHLKYLKKAKKKIKKMFMHKDNYNFVIIFPIDLQTKKLEEIFSSQGRL
ncbi:thiol-disulfide isomerase/thioredoxin [Metabacillus crassostreae]|uniref:hypothetical protein n=1 Tax=Metabacillus crassostreae TaxID=929098 RepID=UPI001957BCD7|nr:hypothetical protein [Metabacillus crassostreae]MBM7605579.1 thiol-disulfide isomerase/thioredoxin [Metabacillus crassostreae]